MATFLSILGLLGIPFGCYLASLVARSGATAWGWCGLGLYVLFDLGLFWLSTEPRRARITLGLAFASLLAYVGLRHTQSFPTSLGALYRLPAMTPGSYAGRLVDELDLGMMAFVAFRDVGAIRREDATRARPWVLGAYRRMRQDPDFAPVPTPMLPTLLGMNDPGAFHALVFNPPAEGRAGRALVVLHGLGGAQKLPCWMLARRLPDALVVCPSAGLRGEWAHANAQAIFETALRFARARARAVYVVGLGYGAHGLQHLMARGLPEGVSGVALVAGLDEEQAEVVRRATLPVLIVRGEDDVRTPRFRVEGLAGTPFVRNHEVPGGALVFYENEDVVLGLLDSHCIGR